MQSEQGWEVRETDGAKSQGILSRAQWMPLEADLTKVVKDHSGSSAISSPRELPAASHGLL